LPARQAKKAPAGRAKAGLACAFFR
jgi:hypothetical protein